MIETLGDYLRNNAHKFPNETAYLYEGETVTFGSAVRTWQQAGIGLVGTRYPQAGPCLHPGAEHAGVHGVLFGLRAVRLHRGNRQLAACRSRDRVDSE